MKNIAKQIIDRLKRNGIIIQRYNAYSTKSIYLKLDYGVSNSLRISDHRGKKHLSYRFNLLTDIDKSYTDDGEYMRHYYSKSDIDKLIADIIQHREKQIEKYGMSGYKSLMEVNKNRNESKRGFWEKAVLV